MKWILASASPRRRELLRLITREFEVRISDCPEEVPAGLPVRKAPELLARQKAEAVAVRFPEDLVIGADTGVFFGREMFGKPKDAEDAARMLRILSGKTHEVITGCALCLQGKTHSFSVHSKVTFYPFGEDEIRAYLQTGESFDKAGAYGIQGRGSLLVQRIQGDYYNIVGLPVAALNREIRQFCLEAERNNL